MRVDVETRTAQKIKVKIEVLLKYGDNYNLNSLSQ